MNKVVKARILDGFPLLKEEMYHFRIPIGDIAHGLEKGMTLLAQREEDTWYTSCTWLYIALKDGGTEGINYDVFNIAPESEDWNVLASIADGEWRAEVWEEKTAWVARNRPAILA